MSKRIFTQEQIVTLQQNPNVLRCSDKSITYHRDFKLAAIRRHQEGLSPASIFKEAGFNLTLIGREEPKWCLGRWQGRTGRKEKLDFPKKPVAAREGENP